MTDVNDTRAIGPVTSGDLEDMVTRISQAVSTLAMLTNCHGQWRPEPAERSRSADGPPRGLREGSERAAPSATGDAAAINADARALIAEAVSRAFLEALNASLQAVAREAPSSTLKEIKSAFLEAWRHEGRSREDYWMGQLDVPRRVLS